MKNPVYVFMQTATRVFFGIYGGMKVIGHDNIPKEGPVVIACNHVSYLDPMMLGSCIKRECAFMARHDLWDKKFLAWLLPKLGSFPVNRGKMDRNAVKTGIERLNQNLVLCIFPEGGRTDDGELQRGEPGTALFVQKTGAKVIPAAVIGPEIMLPVGASKLKRAKLKMIFGKPISFEANETRDHVTATIMREIAKLLTEHGKPSTAREDIEAAGSASNPAED